MANDKNTDQSAETIDPVESAKTIAYSKSGAIARAALDYTSGLKGTPRDRAIFDYMCGAVAGIAFSHGIQKDDLMPSWLWIVGVRGGSRVEEAKKLAEQA